LDVMNAAAKAVVTELPDITIAYGVSDEYRLVTVYTFEMWFIAHNHLPRTVLFFTRQVACSSEGPGMPGSVPIRSSM
jgi:hypothetical protein